MKNQIEEIEKGSANVSEKGSKEKSKKKNPKKAESKSDSLNLENVKINLKKIDPSNFDKEGKGSSFKNLYLGMEGKTQEEKKKFRSKIRRERNRFINQILGKDRSDSERIDSIHKFLIFYKENWRITDFKIENFLQSKDEIEISDCRKLLDVVKRSLEG